MKIGTRECKGGISTRKVFLTEILLCCENLARQVVRERSNAKGSPFVFDIAEICILSNSSFMKKANWLIMIVIRITIQFRILRVQKAMLTKYLEGLYLLTYLLLVSD